MLWQQLHQLPLKLPLNRMKQIIKTIVLFLLALIDVIILCTNGLLINKSAGLNCHLTRLSIASQ